jgi:hypothetical protein
LSTNAGYLITAALIAVYFVLKQLVPAVVANGRGRAYQSLLFCGLACLNLWVHHNRVQSGYGDDLVSPTEKRLEELRRELPSNGRVGFISDGKKSASSASLRRYFLTQYALAPIVVHEGTDADLIIVIVNVEKFVPDSIPHDFVLLRDFGDGVMLFAKRSQ